MMLKNLSKAVLIVLSMTILFGCSSDDDAVMPLDTRSFTINQNPDFFINSNGTINLSLKGNYTDADFITYGTVTERGFVYGTSATPVIGTDESVIAIGINGEIEAFVDGLTKQNYFIRGYFKMSDQSIFYGTEVQIDTNIDASETRTITMTIDTDPFFVSETELTPIVRVPLLLKEAPVELGFEYSINNDFTGTTNTIIIESFEGINILGISVITDNVFYSELITGLTPGTDYFVRAYAKYSDNVIVNSAAVTLTTN